MITAAQIQNAHSKFQTKLQSKIEIVEQTNEYVKFTFDWACGFEVYEWYLTNTGKLKKYDFRLLS